MNVQRLSRLNIERSKKVEDKECISNHVLDCFFVLKKKSYYRQTISRVSVTNNFGMSSFCNNSIRMTIIIQVFVEKTLP